MTAEISRDEEVRRALETIFAADSEIYQTRGFQRRIGFGTRPALLIIDLANAWTRPGHNFTCDNMDVIIPANQKLLAAARDKNIPVIYTTTAYQDPTGPHADTGLWHLKIPVETLREGSPEAAIDERIAPLPARGEQVIVKKRASAFHGTYLAGYLRAQRVDTVIITGVTMAAACATRPRMRSPRASAPSSCAKALAIGCRESSNGTCSTSTPSSAMSSRSTGSSPISTTWRPSATSESARHGRKGPRPLPYERDRRACLSRGRGLRDSDRLEPPSVAADRRHGEDTARDARPTPLGPARPAAGRSPPPPQAVRQRLWRNTQ